MLGNLIQEIENAKKKFDELNQLPYIILNDNIKQSLEEYFSIKYDVVKISQQTSYVRTSEGLYSVFSNQYFYLASLCKNLAIMLVKYFTFLDEYIRPNKEYCIAINNLQNIIQSDDCTINSPDEVEKYLNSNISIYGDITKNLSKAEKESMLVFLSTQINLFDLSKKKETFKKFKHENTFRATNDLFGGYILKVIPIENASSNMLAVLINLLAKNEILYNDLCNNIEIISTEEIKRIYKSEEKENYSIEELSTILEHNYNNSGEAGKVAAIHMFGIRYGNIILRNEYQVSQIIKNAKMHDSYVTELSKGINLYKNIASGNFGLSFDKTIINEDMKMKFEANEALSFKNLLDTNNSILERYINSLLAKPFTILTGNSGTGKTRIAKQLAEWLRKESDTGVLNSLVVPVGADWTDNTKVLGYFNPLANNGTGDFVKTDILKFIELANDNPKVPFFLILDEMNLSHVERYFSDFLSAMESKKPILLYKKPDKCECLVPESIMLPDNLFVTGTVNIDETTYMFSPKVLDRANVIEFTPEKDEILKIFKNKPKISEIEPAPAGMPEGFVELSQKVKSFENGPVTEDSATLEKIFGELYEILKTAGFEFAYRTTKEITLYYCAAKYIDNNVSTMKIIDEQIVQKILPKIHGNKKQIGDMLNQLKTKFDDYDELELSQAKVQSMIDKLDKFQYASFI